MKVRVRAAKPISLELDDGSLVTVAHKGQLLTTRALRATGGLFWVGEVDTDGNPVETGGSWIQFDLNEVEVGIWLPGETWWEARQMAAHGADLSETLRPRGPSVPHGWERDEK